MSDIDPLKIDLEQTLRRIKVNSDVHGTLVTVPVVDLSLALLEIYQKAAEIGWETKVLDVLNEAFRQAGKP
jgi:hypothetical protein